MDTKRQAQKKKRTRGHIAKLRIPEFDERQFHGLLTALYNGVNKNDSMMSRLLGISKVTVTRWFVSAPGKGKQWWWPVVLQFILLRLYEDMRDSAHSKYRERAAEIYKSLKRYGIDELTEQFEWNDAQDDGCFKWLLATMADRPTGDIAVEELLLPGNRGGYSKRSIQRAAERLGLIRYKRKKNWHYRLPSIIEGDIE